MHGPVMGVSCLAMRLLAMLLADPPALPRLAALTATQAQVMMKERRNARMRRMCSPLHWHSCMPACLPMTTTSRVRCTRTSQHTGTHKRSHSRVSHSSGSGSSSSSGMYIAMCTKLQICVVPAASCLGSGCTALSTMSTPQLPPVLMRHGRAAQQHSRQYQQVAPSHRAPPRSRTCKLSWPASWRSCRLSCKRRKVQLQGMHMIGVLLQQLRRRSMLLLQPHTMPVLACSGKGTWMHA